MAHIYKVILTKKEQEELQNIIKKGKHTSQTYRTAYVLLNTDIGEYSDKITNEEISKVLKIGMRTIDRIKKRFVEEGFESCLVRKPTSREYERKIDGEVEAHLISISCGKPPEGFSRWSLRLLADKMVELNYIENISHESVRKLLKKRIKAMESKGMVNPTRKEF